MSANMNTVNQKININPEVPEQEETLPDNELVRQAVVEDPVVRFLYEKRDAITYLLLAVVVAVLGFRWYNDSHQQAQASAAKVFAGLQDSFSKIEAAAKSGQAPEQSLMLKFDSEVKTLAAQGQPYASLASVYSGLKSVSEKKYSLAAEELSKVNWEKISDASPENIVIELKALYLAKALLAEKDYQSQAKSALQSLAEKGSYAAWPALHTLFALADDSEKAGLDALKEAYKTRHPEQIDLVENNL